MPRRKKAEEIEGEKSSVRGRQAAASVRTDEGTREDVGAEEYPGTLFPGDWPSDSYVMVHRFDDVEKTKVYHGRLLVAEATEETLARLFGGGRYALLLKSRNAEGRPVYMKQVIVRLEGPYRRPSSLPGAEPDAPVPSAGPVVVHGRSDAETNPASVLNTAIVSQLIDMMRLSKEVLSRPPVDLAGIITAVTPILVPLLTRRGPEPLSPADVGEQITRAVREAVQGIVAPAQPASVVSQVVEAVRALREAGEDMGIGESRSSGDPLMDAIPRLAEVLANATRRDVPAAVPTVPGPASVAGEPWQVILVQHGRRLVQFARMRASPEWAAETAVTLMPPDARESLTQFVMRPDAQAVMQTVVPELAAFPQWVGSFIEECRVLLGNEEEPVGEMETDHG